MKQQLSIYKCTGKGYERGWWTNCHCRYRIYEGARNTKKSYDMIGLEVLDKIISQPLRNVLILRQVSRSNRNSTFSNIVSLINQPDVNNSSISLARYFKINNGDMTITYLPTGQRIIFEGMSEPTKINSIKVPHGYLTDVYVEEAFEIDSYDDFRKIDGSVRGILPDGYFFQVTFCLNPWNKDCWIYDKYFKGRLEDDYNYLETHDYMDYLDNDYIGDYGIGLYLHKSTYRINDFRDKETYDVSMENLKKVALEIYKVEALGMWGNSTEATYPEFSEKNIISRGEANNFQFCDYAIGVDTGLSNGEGKIKYGEDVRLKTATTMQLVGISKDCKTLVCLDEYFYSNENQPTPKTQDELMKDCINKILDWIEFYQSDLVLMKNIIYVYVDCADIGFRQGLELMARSMGLYNIRFIGSTKMKIQTRVDFVRLLMAWGEYKVSEACVNLIREIKNSRKGDKGECREDFDDHAINSNEYAWATLVGKLRRWGDFKQH